MSSSDGSDVVVIGDGLVGLCCAYTLVGLGARVHLVGRRRHGFASSAGAGLLAPTIEAASGEAGIFALAARDRYRSYLGELEARTGIAVPLDPDGILRVASSDAEAISLRAQSNETTHWLTQSEVAALEPNLSAPHGALHHARDGMVDNIRLLAALESAVTVGGVLRLAADAVRLDFSNDVAVVETGVGTRIRCQQVVLAAGAWSRLIDGLPRPLPVIPLRGQMMALAGVHVRRPVYGFGGYLAPRHAEGFTIAGSTSESVGFTVATTDSALAEFRRVAAALVPDMQRADEIRSWAGLRPMTMDGLPILDRDPEIPSLIYACGHSRNGILTAPLTGEVVGALVSGAEVPYSLAPFAMSRFALGETLSG